MGKIHALIFAGAAALCAQSANAADMLPPPPMPDAPILRGSVAPEFSGWYIRGDVGVGANRTRDWDQPGNVAAAGTTLTQGIHSTSLASSAFVSIGAGYQFNNWFRADVTSEYRGAASAKGTYQAFQNSIATPCVVGGAAGNCALFQNNYAGTVQASVFLLNGYIDLGTFHGVTPYVGGGIGFARTTTTGFTDSGVNVIGNGINAAGQPNGASAAIATSPIADRSKFKLAWAAMAGVSYDVNANLKLDIGYRYLDMGRVTTGQINCLCAQTFPGFNMNRFASHDLKIGMRWLINDGPAPIMASAPMPQYGGPLVRKY